MKWHPLEKTALWLCFARSEREKRNPSVHDTDGCNSLLYDWGHSVIIPVMDGQFLFHTTLILWDMQFSLQASFQRRGQGMQMVKRREGCVKGKKKIFIYLFMYFAFGGGSFSLWGEICLSTLLETEFWANMALRHWCWPIPLHHIHPKYL